MELAELDAQISKITSQLAELKAKRQQRSELFRSLRAVLSPLRRVPAELLAEIFQCCCQNSLAAEFYSITDPLEAPVLLGHICSFWRTISHNTPRLWNMIHFYTNFPPTDRLAEYVGALAEKSRNLPLLVGIDTCTPCPRSLSPPASPSPEIIWHLRHRLQALRLDLEDRDRDLSVMIGSDTAFPSLQTLVVNVHPVDYNDIPLESILDVFGQTPRLRHLTLDTSFATWDFGSPNFPWAQLTSLRLNAPLSVFAGRSILVQCTQLTTCNMLYMQSSEEEEPDLPLCVLKDITSFQFASWDDGVTSPFFQPFSFPTLKSLTITAYDWPRNVLLDFHARSGFNLTLLKLDHITLDADGLIPFLRVLPTLTVLSIKDAVCVEDRLFEAFTYDSSSRSTEITLPLLATLTLEHFSHTLHGETVVRMVESLWQLDNPEDAAFPSLACIQLGLTGPRFNDDVETRLANICSTEFLVDFQERS
ncbi:hypothetical protein C8R44DRAFT_657685 [Mycena epipterygia]|nr:hypothetical protein C8R44DRAFT_657685 [Mycena epipterygia]